MDLSTWLVYSAVALVSILSPGPAILFAISNSISLGFRRAVFSSLGNICGLFIVSSLTMTGLGVILKTSSLLFTLLKIIGAGYLIYLGIKQWRSKNNIFTQVNENTAALQRTNLQLFLKGVFIAITNPKAILFFSALFPQFIKTGQKLMPQFLILTSTFMLFSFCVLMFYAYISRYVKTWFSNERRASMFNRVSGSLFMLLGISLVQLKHK